MTEKISRQRRAAAVGILLALGLTGCRQKDTAKVEQDEEPPKLASMIHTNDPRSAGQLITGFHGIEQNAWRWTARRFSVVLRPPVGSAQSGAVLNLKLAAPDVLLSQLKTVTLSAAIGGTMLAPETYSQPGAYTYTREVPGSALAGDTVRVDFQLDKALPPGGDKRELGVVVSSISLDAK